MSKSSTAKADKEVENLLAVLRKAEQDGVAQEIRPVEYLANRGLAGESLAYAVGEFILKRYGKIST